MPDNIVGSASFKVRRDGILTGDVVQINLHEESSKFIWRNADGTPLKDTRLLEISATTRGAAFTALTRAWGTDVYNIKK